MKLETENRNFVEIILWFSDGHSMSKVYIKKLLSLIKLVLAYIEMN